MLSFHSMSRASEASFSTLLASLPFSHVAEPIAVFASIFKDLFVSEYRFELSMRNKIQLLLQEKHPEVGA